MNSLCRVSAEGEAGERGEASAGDKENAGREARASGAAADVRERLGLGGNRQELPCLRERGNWSGVRSQQLAFGEQAFALVD